MVLAYIFLNEFKHQLKVVLIFFHLMDSTQDFYFMCENDALLQIIIL